MDSLSVSFSKAKIHYHYKNHICNLISKAEIQLSRKGKEYLVNEKQNKYIVQYEKHLLIQCCF